MYRNFPISDKKTRGCVWLIHKGKKDYVESLDTLVMKHTQPEITCLKLTIETLEQSVKYVQS